MAKKKIDNALDMMSKVTKDLQHMTKPELEEIADAAEVSYSLLRHWKLGRVEYPLLCNFVAVAEVLGYKVVMS